MLFELRLLALIQWRLYTLGILLMVLIAVEFLRGVQTFSSNCYLKSIDKSLRLMPGIRIARSEAANKETLGRVARRT